MSDYPAFCCHNDGEAPNEQFVGQTSRSVRMGLQPTNRDENPAVGQALGPRRPLRPPGLAFNNLRWVFDRAWVFRTRFAASAARSGVHCNTRRFSMRIPAAVLLAALCPALAQSPLALPGCEARPEVRQVIDGKLANKALENMKFIDRLALKHQVLDDLIAKYPRELEPYRQLIQATRFDDPEAYAALSERYVKQAEQHPDDPLAQYLAALVLTGKDTPRSVQLLEQARSKAPVFAWPAISLARAHATGKLADKKKAAEEAAAFFAICPSSTDPAAQRILNRTAGTELQARVAAALRARLAKETEPKRLEDYATLWGLEFRTRPPQEHDALRKQVAEDLKRLEPMNPSPDAEWLAFLKDGYKQSGASAETVTAMEDRVVQVFPRSEEAFDIVDKRWEKAHKEPEDQKDAAVWAKYNAESEAAAKGWIAQ